MSFLPRPIETLTKCTDTYANEHFPQLSPTFLGAKVVDTNLVPSYLTVPAHEGRSSGSYSRFLCWSHSNRMSNKAHGLLVYNLQNMTIQATQQMVACIGNGKRKKSMPNATI